MNLNVAGALLNLNLFAAFMAVGWFGPAIVCVVCVAFSLWLASMDRTR